jgi:hypothetical protein
MIEDGTYASEEEVVDALLEEGLASPELTEGEFWDSVNARTDALLVEYLARRC